MHTPSEKAEIDIAKQYVTELPAALSLEEIIRAIRSLCIHCNGVPKILPRQLGLTNAGSKPREFLLMDYLFIEPEHGYLLCLVDDHSRKIKLTHTKSADSLTAVKPLEHWRDNFGFINNFYIKVTMGATLLIVCYRS